jgi:threonine aldolase
MAALAEANRGYARGYGDDAWTSRAERRFAEVFGREVRVFLVGTGTSANALALATMVPPYGSVFCHEQAHIVRDECGAPEFMTGGARLQLLPGAGAKLTPEALLRGIAENPTAVHTVQPRAVSISQATELGTIYTPDELNALSATAHANGLLLHMDGARFANAVASLGCKPAEASGASGVDVLSFGATKNGALAAEAVVFFDPARAADFEFRRKRAGHLFSKMRYVAAQWLAYLEDDLWLRLAARANAHARRIGEAAGALRLEPVEANEIFVRPGAAGIAALRAQGFEFYDWGAEGSGEARFVVSWDQTDEDVDALCTALGALPKNATA